MKCQYCGATLSNDERPSYPDVYKKLREENGRLEYELQEASQLCEEKEQEVATLKQEASQLCEEKEQEVATLNTEIFTLKETNVKLEKEKKSAVKSFTLLMILGIPIFIIALGSILSMQG